MNDDSNNYSAGKVLLFAVGILLVLAVTVYMPMQIMSRAEEQRASNTEEFVAETRDMWSQFADELEKNIESGDAGGLDLEFTVDNPAGGMRGEFQALMVELMNDNVAHTNEYFAELDRVGLMRLLDPVRLKADSDFSESREILANAADVIDAFKARAEQIQADFPDKIMALDINEADKRAALENFEVGVKQSAPQKQRMWQLEHDSMQELVGLIDLLEASEWTMEDDYFTFQDDSKAERFNQHLENIDRITAEQNAIRRGILSN